MTATSKKFFEHLGVLAFFLLAALVSTYPIIFYFRSHYLGAPGSDSQVFAWNVWHFRYTLLNGENPLWSYLQYWPCGGVLLFHSYAIFNNILGFFLQDFMNLASALNTISIASCVAGAWAAYALLRHLGASPRASILAGIIFAFNFQTANLVGREYDYMWTAPLPLFILFFLKTRENPRPLWCLAGALTLSWAWLCAPYYFNFCLILAGLLSFLPYLHISWIERPRLKRKLLLIPAALGVLGGLLWLPEQKEFHGSGSAKDILLYVLPYWFVFGSALLALAAWSPKRPSVSLDHAVLSAKNWGPLAGTLIAWAALNAPLLWSIYAMQYSGIALEETAKWRGGGIVFDLLNYAVPNLSHPLLSNFENAVPGVRGGAIGWVLPAFLIFFHRRFSLFSLPKAKIWMGILIVSAVLSLGPFLSIGGFKTYIPLPFWFFRQLPLLGNMFGVERFVTLNYLMLAILTALALDAWKERKGLFFLVFSLVIVEFWHGAQPLSSWNRATPSMRRLAEKPEGTLLYLPFGAIFRNPQKDMGVSRLNDVYYQIWHQQPMINGAYGRSASYAAEALNRSPFLSELSAVQKGAAPGPYLTRPELLRRSLRDFRIRYILVEESLVPAPLLELVKRWPVKLVGREGGIAVYEF